jgi:hypothetical protein
MAGAVRISQLPLLSEASVADVLPIAAMRDGTFTTYKVPVSKLLSPAIEESMAIATGFPFVTDGVTDNSAVWAEFIAYCISNDVVGVLPAGTIYIANAPGTISATDQVDVPSIRNAAKMLRIRGAGENLTILKAKVAARSPQLVALVSNPILRLVGGVGFEMTDLTLDGGVIAVPTVESGMRALTLTSPTGDVEARKVCTMVETDEVPYVRLERVRVRGFYGHRDNTEWPEDPDAFRSRRTGGLCIHRASQLDVRDITLDHVAAREGIYFANCERVNVSGFYFDGVVAEQEARGSHGLSTALNVFGPETQIARISNFRVDNTGGSSMNVGGVDIEMAGGRISGDIGTAYGDGLDFGVEHQVRAFPSHPAMRRLSVTDVQFRGCSRYSLRAYHEDALPAGDIILDNLLFDRCYQGVEISACKRVALGSILVRDCFFRADYEASGRGVYVASSEAVTWQSIVVDASGGDGIIDYMNYGIYLDQCKKVAGGVAVLNELKSAHLAIYQASVDPDLASSGINLGVIHCFQTQTRDDSVFAPITLGRSSGRVAGLSGDLYYNGLPALLTSGVVRINSDTLPAGIQRQVLGQPSTTVAYNAVLGRLDFVNGDGSGGLSDLIRGSVVARTKGSNGRGATLQFETAGRNDPRAVNFEITEHGSTIVPPSVSTFDPRTRRLGEQWTDNTGLVWRCTVEGRTSTTPAPVSVSAEAYGNTSLLLSSTTDFDVGDLIYAGTTGPLEIQAIVSTSITVDVTVTAGTGLAITAPEAVIVRMAAISQPSISYADVTAAIAGGISVGALFFRSDGVVAWRAS